MTGIDTNKIYSLLLLLLPVILFGRLLAQESHSRNLVVIVNQDVSVNELQLQDLRDYYLRDRLFWPDDKPIVLFDLQPRTDIKNRFYDFLGKSSSRMKSIWLKKMLAGEGQPPEAVESEEEMVKKVAETPGAIGFVSNEKADASVKVLMMIESEKQ